MVMMKYPYFFLTLLMGLLMSGCQTAPYHFYSHLQSPEVSSDQVSIEVGVGSSPARPVYLVPDAVKGSTGSSIRGKSEFYDTTISNNTFRIWIPEWPFDWTISEMKTDAVVPMNLNLGRAQLFFNSPMIGGKFQILGEAANKAKKGNFSTSLIATYSYQRVEDTAIDLGVPDSTLNGVIYYRGLSVGLVSGIRTADNGGIALDFMAMQHDIKGTGVVDATGGSQNLVGQFTDYGAGVQVYFTTQRMHLLIEQMWTQIKEPVRETAYIVPSLHVLFSAVLF